MTFIVTDRNGNIKERFFKLHGTEAEASVYGRDAYGPMKFLIQKFSTWRKSKNGRFQGYRIASLQRMRRFIKPK